jgi:hypothetical protein
MEFVAKGGRIMYFELVKDYPKIEHNFGVFENNEKIKQNKIMICSKAGACDYAEDCVHAKKHTKETSCVKDRRDDCPSCTKVGEKKPKKYDFDSDRYRRVGNETATMAGTSVSIEKKFTRG